MNATPIIPRRQVRTVSSARLLIQRIMRCSLMLVSAHPLWSGLEAAGSLASGHHEDLSAEPWLRYSKVKREPSAIFLQLQNSNRTHVPPDREQG